MAVAMNLVRWAQTVVCGRHVAQEQAAGQLELPEWTAADDEALDAAIEVWERRWLDD